MRSLGLLLYLLSGGALASLGQDTVSKLAELADVKKGNAPDVEVLKIPRSRQPKLFYISSTTSTTMFTTSTFCFVASAATGVASACKRKRAITSRSREEWNADIQPMKTSTSPENEKELEGAKREGRWLNYWITTTITTATTSYTATATIASVVCTPYGYSVSQCPSG